MFKVTRTLLSPPHGWLVGTVERGVKFVLKYNLYNWYISDITECRKSHSRTAAEASPLILKSLARGVLKDQIPLQVVC